MWSDLAAGLSWARRNAPGLRTVAIDATVWSDAGAMPAEAKVHASSSTHLRELLAADHRYVFTLIHKFRMDRQAGEASMPVLSASGWSLG